MKDDLISRKAAIDALEREKSLVERPITETRWFDFGLRKAQDVLSELPSAQAEPISEAYANAVWTWLINYQIKAAELKGRYTPYEVLSWVANDWRKEHERSDQQTGGD